MYTSKSQITNVNYNNRIVKHFWDANYIIQKHYHNLKWYGNIVVICLNSTCYNILRHMHLSIVHTFVSFSNWYIFIYALHYITSNSFTKSSAKQTCLDISECGQKQDITYLDILRNTIYKFNELISSTYLIWYEWKIKNQ